MGAKVQSKAYFPGSMIDLNCFGNGMWDPYHHEKTHKISGHGNTQDYDYFLTTQAINGYAKEQIRQTIMKHESIFKHQLQELHRLYKRQQDLMSPRFPLLGLNFRPPERRVIDLELPGDEQQAGIFQKLTTKHTLTDLNEHYPSAKRMLFGVEINSGSSFQNLPKIHHNHWLSPFSGNSRSMTNSTMKNPEKDEQSLPEWMIKGKESTVHHINLDSLQNHSQQFFKKVDFETRESKKVKLDDSRSAVTKILGVPIRLNIDLNLSLEEEEEEEEEDAPPAATPSSPESVKEIDLEAPAASESDNSMENDLELVNIAAEAIVSISTFDPPEESYGTLVWFADVITKVKKKEEIDFFEYMTLKLEDSKEEYENYKPMIVEEDDDGGGSGSLSKRKGRRGRQKKDFQKDILPGIVSLSRREVTEDLQIFEEAFSVTGVSWQSSLSKRKGRGRRRSVAAEPLSPVVVVECRDLALEKSLGGWGRRTRRIPRQRCSNGGNHHRYLALKC